jgi:hypothetical protein
MASRDITDELVSEIARDLQTRYALDDEDMRAVGERLAGDRAAGRTEENVNFAERFLGEHPSTFDRLSR